MFPTVDISLLNLKLLTTISVISGHTSCIFSCISVILIITNNAVFLQVQGDLAKSNLVAQHNVLLENTYS